MTKKTTPMINQFLKFKNKHNEKLLFFRMGDFYELFFEDAKIASNILNITLTSRGTFDDKPIPMCGIPHHAASNYVSRLIKEGHKVVICEQKDTPSEAKEKGNKILSRYVERIITPGTVFDDDMLNAKESNYILSIYKEKNNIGLAWIDISTGEFNIQNIPEEELSSNIVKIKPKEILLPQKMLNENNNKEIFKSLLNIITTIPESKFNLNYCTKKLEKYFNVIAIKSIANFSSTEISAASVLLEYIELTQIGNLPLISKPNKISINEFLQIDANTQKSLEIIEPINKDSSFSLINVIDKTSTSSGARLLKKWLVSPLYSIEKIEYRSNAVNELFKDYNTRDDIKNILKKFPDIQRALTRLSMKKKSPRDIMTIKKGLGLVNYLNAKISLLKSPLFKNSLDKISNYDALLSLLNKAINENPPLNIREGGVIAIGFSAKLDQLRNINNEAERHKNNLEQEYKKNTGIDKLKINFNNVIGYFVETTKRNSEKINQEVFIHRQTMKNTIRYTTKELSDLEKNILTAKEKSIALEEELISKIVETIMSFYQKIMDTALAFSTIDCITSFAEIAYEKNWCLPVINNSLEFNIEKGKHPTITEVIENTNNEFVVNDCKMLDSKNLWLMTGPNMAGKSTFLRQNALIAILAQTGSFVPAKSCSIGIIDKIFSRVGASDDLSKGHSTFMMEMIETATILNQATKKSFIILDEIGRGTATYDGMAIAWSVIEHIYHINKCRCLFATHYHELTEINKKLKNISLYTMDIKEWNGKIIFLYKIKEGTTDKSYGIHVAKLAGIPSIATNRAQEILDNLEKNKKNEIKYDKIRDFQQNNNHNENKENKIINEIKKISLDDISPKKALEILYKIKIDIKNTGK